MALEYDFQTATTPSAQEIIEYFVRQLNCEVIGDNVARRGDIVLLTAVDPIEENLDERYRVVWRCRNN